MIDETLVSNLVSELRRGTQILAVLAQLNTGKYGYALLQDLADQGAPIEAGTLYPLLRRLETQGILSSTWDTQESRPRKYYTLSPQGKELYTRLIAEWTTLRTTLDRILSEEPHAPTH
jgi:DNA-binding PadR family transcriptional regulator